MTTTTTPAAPLTSAVRLVDEDFGGERSSLYLMDEGALRLAAVRGYPQPLSQIDPRSGRLTALLASGRSQPQQSHPGGLGRFLLRCHQRIWHYCYCA